VRPVRGVLHNGEFKTSTQQLGNAVRRDATSDAVICELEDISDGDEQSDRNAFESAGESSIQA
jgi:hypothetical protein